MLVRLASFAAAIAFFWSPQALAAPNFKAPYPCGQRYSYYHHSNEVRQALDFNAPGGTPVLASAAGRAWQYYEANGAGNYVVVDHGDGWKTYYFHLSSFSTANGVSVSQGQKIGVTGNTGNSFGAHIHYEQLLNGVGQVIRINGVSLAPYPGGSGVAGLTSDNACGGNPPQPGQYWVDTFANAPGFASPTSTAQTGTLNKGTNYVFCKAWGREIRNGASFNHWWLKTDLDVGPAGQWVSAYYLSRWGNDEAKDNNGNVIPDCSPPAASKYWVDTHAAAPGYGSPTSTAQTGTLNQGTSYVFCKAWGREIRNGSSFNHWWLKTDLDVGPAGQWVSAYYLSRWGNDEAKDNNGAVIPDC